MKEFRKGHRVLKWEEIIIIKIMEVATLAEMAWNLRLARKPRVASFSNLLFTSWAHQQCRKRNQT